MRIAVGIEAHRRSRSAGGAVHSTHAMREGAAGAGEAHVLVFVVVGVDRAVGGAARGF